ncbi:MAG TPA: hypothetical protein VK463_13060 [Desulfomonilaceae bacterium]|nr:hypothetical protein [Desulfomonilaceae bacterium]
MKFVIVGYGKFGRIALQRLSTIHKGVDILVVELSGARLRDVPKHVTVLEGNAPEIIAHAAMLQDDDVIIPMVPFNLAAEYVLRLHSASEKVPLPKGIAELVPNPYLVDEYNLACSRARFLCPDDCPEGECCTITGEFRHPLYGELAEISVPDYTLLVQRSRQILPGIGGYSFKSLKELDEQIRSGAFIIATSCKCHAILTSVRI